jgi:hypothetical protein
VYYTIIIEVIM